MRAPQCPSRLRAPRVRPSAASIAAAAVLVACSGGGERSATDPDEWLPGGSTTNTLVRTRDGALQNPAPTLDVETRQAFFSGNAFFEQNWVEAPSSTSARDGLGPLFNARSCGTCHFKDGRGRPPLEPGEAFSGLLLRLSVAGVDADGAPLPDPSYGGQLQPFALDDVPAEGSPRVEYETIRGEYADGEPYELLQPSYYIDDLAFGALSEGIQISPRVAPAMVGLGLLEAIPDERLLGLADPEDADGDGISGKVNRVWDVALGDTAVGRFGWKAEQPSVRQQAAGAFHGDMGLTSSLFPAQDCMPGQAACLEATAGGEPEVSDQQLDRVRLYSSVLAVPQRDDYASAEVLRGKALFRELGCASCHVPSHTTGADFPIATLSDQLIYPYTDLLLHDLGDALSDQRPSFEAEGNEWRTPPLWALRYYEIVNGHDRLLHDGRARGVAEAVLWHGGEAEESKQGFVQAPAADRAALVRFVESL
jgi:CxxC motif-containing protein (DUF1111 family)